ncbi:hypothetical protein [Actinosynnema sp. ALI-1.44]|uniref:hypothetical protein n=1 Tax=Actinosynnema sp. ALI-1.44 TaxID=1933779 RepID=UPI00143CE9C5|nr:hypothetical protein [Actinosynnema sp. ALI-1.44]
MPEIAEKVKTTTGKNAGISPSVASVYRALADDSDIGEEVTIRTNPRSTAAPTTITIS